MGDLLWVAYLIILVVTVADVIGRITGKVERILWLIAVAMVPVVGIGLWWYVRVQIRERARKRQGRA